MQISNAGESWRDLISKGVCYKWFTDFNFNQVLKNNSKIKNLMLPVEIKPQKSTSKKIIVTKKLKYPKLSFYLDLRFESTNLKRNSLWVL